MFLAIHDSPRDRKVAGRSRNGRKLKPLLFQPDEILQLKQAVIDVAGRAGFRILRKSGDRSDVPIDYRFLDMLLRAAEDPEVGLGDYAQGVKVGPGTRMPRLPALY